MAYISDLKNHDVRTEGMSYGMMIAMHQYTHVPVHGTATVCQWVYEYLDTWLHY